MPQYAYQGKGHYEAKAEQKEPVERKVGLVVAQVRTYWDFKSVPEEPKFSIKQMEIGQRIAVDKSQALGSVKGSLCRWSVKSLLEGHEFETLKLGSLAHIGGAVGFGIGAYIEAEAALEGYGRALDLIVAQEKGEQNEEESQGKG